MTLFKIVGIAVAALSFSAQSALVTVDTSLWTESLSPSSNKQSQHDNWVRVDTNNPTKLSNSSGSLISDFTVAGDFTFNGLFTPRYASNPSCAAENTCDDDDILGLVFGWQDASNHYRLGWSQGDGTNSSGVKDITGKTGLFLIKEVNGASNTIMNWDRDFWLEDVEYTFNISRFDDAISIAVEGIMQGVAGIQGATLPGAPAAGSFKNIAFTTNDTSFTSGRVGVYTESQTGEFASLNVTVPGAAVGVSAPATFAIAMLGGFALFARRRTIFK